MKSIMNHRLKNDTLSPGVREKLKIGDKREYFDCGAGVEQFKTDET